ncbi:32 kDa-cell wall symbiosis regulated acidic polypeptide precursor [Pisolithus orientalis]|uniref:32 kDa-cell wall symbiosis regulated acidic polypeptide precursor n=1 Tax=Pisolithus orientalis TaxID=936130 RepID=UPI0022242FB6|nr:32 kDa-cell wall symbiosis regulated acidic polypeptide precursor [Pisolithus orientalis]KAI6000421.1 32 kDa-cell wall symbiosis regulated acidic polypeptide precursor [Pisolithus orientalis]
MSCSVIGSASAAVCVSVLLVFLPDVSAQHQEDVRNSFELAARAADKASGDDYAKWFNTFKTTLLNIHWFSQQDGREEEVNGLVFDSLNVSKSERELLTRALNALQQKAENEEALKLFNQGALAQVNQDVVSRLLFIGGGSYHGKFQLAICSEKNGAIAVSTSYVHFSVDGAQYSSVLYADGKVETKTTLSAHVLGLNEEQYRKVRESIKKKLVDTGVSEQAPVVGL